MCEEACLVCGQCEKFKNGCKGQIGDFDKALCPIKNEEAALVS